VQPIDKIWDIDENVRTAWNAVMFNLNEGTSDLNVKYLRTFDGTSRFESKERGKDSIDHYNELEAGFKHHLRVLCKLFSIDQTDVSSKAEMERAYEFVLEQIGRRRVAARFLACNLLEVSNFHKDYGGLLLISAFNGDGSLFSSFILRFLEDLGHAEAVDATLL
jgi:hypothetical protein